ncbi:glutathione-dependent formaldehyde-activating, GFA [Biscogniauxia marginata]|nr:glutathione-dependent formaldehyde-activating, GFA [Biscogniauxia marginata]
MSSTRAVPSIQTYDANCHCGKVQFTVTMPDIRSSKIITCNCSICTKNGYLFVYPKREDVVFSSGEQHLSSYRFGNKKKPHKFCPTCGTSILIDFAECDREIERQVTAINIRSFAGIEDVLGDLEFKQVDGKNKLGPAYSAEKTPTE